MTIFWSGLSEGAVYVLVALGYNIPLAQTGSFNELAIPEARPLVAAEPGRFVDRPRVRHGHLLDVRAADPALAQHREDHVYQVRLAPAAPLREPGERDHVAEAVVVVGQHDPAAVTAPAQLGDGVGAGLVADRGVAELVDREERAVRQHLLGVVEVA